MKTYNREQIEKQIAIYAELSPLDYDTLQDILNTSVGEEAAMNAMMTRMHLSKDAATTLMNTTIGQLARGIDQKYEKLCRMRDRLNDK